LAVAAVARVNPTTPPASLSKLTDRTLPVGATVFQARSLQKAIPV